jgi:hypothetical protein
MHILESTAVLRGMNLINKHSSMISRLVTHQRSKHSAKRSLDDEKDILSDNALLM